MRHIASSDFATYVAVEQKHYSICASASGKCIISPLIYLKFGIKVMGGNGYKLFDKSRIFTNIV